MHTIDEIPAVKLPDLFSDALDEIHGLRSAAAYERLLLIDHLTFKTFPKSRRQMAEDQAERLALAARGKWAHAYGGTGTLSLDHSMREAGAPVNIYVGDWAAAQPAPHAPLRPRPVDAEEAASIRDDLERAVREINGLRRGLAYDAAVLLVHAAYASFPKSCAAVTAEQAARMRASARGESLAAYADVFGQAKDALVAAGAPMILTNDLWLAEQPRRRA